MSNYRKNRNKNECEVAGCLNTYRCSGYCALHYSRIRATGTTEQRITHGMHNSPEYTAWKHMKDRCFNKNCKIYKYYGARDISVCDEWKNSFQNFIDYIGKRPSPEHSIDRIDNDGNYEPGNVRWATRVQQNYNKRQLKRTITQLTGAFPSRIGGRYTAHISAAKHYYHLGTYDTAQEAHSVYMNVREQILAAYD